MRKFIRVIGILTAFSCSAVISTAALAHGEHGHDSFATVSMVEAKGIASQEINRLIQEGKIDQSWAKASLNAAMLRVNNQRQWVVTTKTEQEDKKLQLFLSTEGNFLSYEVLDL